ncbi:hypothetical protein BJ742DRAFT_375028 [Cladochytrium replicatum]|nr:hypothetical protein BJ742DRAFT_375028 [Cladochytrium replicatum]
MVGFPNTTTVSFVRKLGLYPCAHSAPVMQTELDTFGDVLNHSGTPSAFTIPPYDITQMESWLNQLHQNIQDEFYHDHSLQHGSSPPRLGESGSSSVSVLHHQMSQASTYGVMPPFSLTPDLSSSLTDRGITSSPASATSLPRGERNGLSYPHDPNDPSSFFAILPPPPTTIAGIPATIAPSLLTSNAIYFDPATSATVQSPEHLKEQERKLKQQEAELAQQQALLRQQQEQLRQQQLQLQQQLYSTTAASVSSTAGIGLAEETPRVVPRYNIPERVVYTMVRQRAAYDEDESSESDHERSVVDGAPPPPPRRRLTSSSVASTAISTSGAFGENLSRTATGSLSIGSLRPRVDVTPSVPPRRNPPKAGTQAPPPPARETSAQVTSTADSSLPPAVPPRKKPPASKTNSMISAVTTIIEDESKARDGAEDISTMMEKKLNISELKGELERESSDVERVQRRKRLEKHLRIVSFLMEKVRAIRAVKKQGDSGEGKERDGAVGRMVAAC